MNATFKTVMLWMSLLVVIFLAWHFAQIQKKETSLKFSEFMTQVDAGQVQDATIVGYGLDHSEYYRGLPYLGTITRPAAPSPGRAEK